MRTDWSSFVDDAIDYAFIVISESGIIERWSAGAEFILGWSADEIIGKPFETIFTAPDRRHHIDEDELEAARKNGTTEDSRWHRRVDSTSVYVNGMTRWLPDDRVFIKIVRDVTTHPRAERRTEAFLDATRVIASADDPDSALENILERLGEDLLWDAAALWRRGAVPTVWLREHTKDPMAGMLRAATLDDPPLSTCLTTPGIDWSTSMELDKGRLITELRDSGIRTMLLVPFHSEIQVEGIMGFFSHELRPPDQHIVKMMSNLGDLVERLYERTASMKVLRSSLALRDELIATISHDLRTPLTTIQGWAQLMTDAPPDERHEAAGRIAEAVRQQEELLEDLLAATTTADGLLEVKRSRVDLRATLTELVAMGKVQIEKKNLKVSTSFPEFDCAAEVDPRRLRQIIWNLLSNAIKFTPDNGSITLGLRCENDRAIISVADTGRGMTQDEITKAFTRFWSQDESGKGTGLGLYVAKNLAEAHGGLIRAESEGSGRGAVFTVELPRFAP